jgi:uncharacterized phage protein (TIGR01671 family)
MREIKFRAWDILDNRFAISDNLIITNDGFFRGFTAFENNETSTGLILEQYTGLKDNNGREIYEGDIVRGIMRHGGGCSSKPGKPCLFQVVIYCGGWGYETALRTVTNLKGDYRTYPNLDAVEVIGNIHENPELLGGHHAPTN